MEQAQVRECTMVTIKYRITTIGPYGEKWEAPFATSSFVYGVDAQYRSVEIVLMGKRPGDWINVHVPPEEIFGNYDETLVRKLPRFDYKQERLKEGKMYRQIRKKCLVQFMVREIRDDVIIADFNDTRAGTSADFDILIEDVRIATKSEMLPSCTWD
ncbi:MAG: peptidylprolyl isomerase [Syntrophobacteraceae bacterium]